MPVPLSSSSEYRTVDSAPNGTTYWYWMQPRLPYIRFHPSTRSSGMEERGDGLHADVALARLAEPELVERPRRLQVDEARTA